MYFHWWKAKWHPKQAEIKPLFFQPPDPPLDKRRNNRGSENNYKPQNKICKAASGQNDQKSSGFTTALKGHS